MKKRELKKLCALFTAVSLAFTSGVGTQALTAEAAQSEENILKLEMDENGYLTPTQESQEMLAELESQKFSWDNATVYFVLTDRFLNSDKSNDHSYGRGLDQNGNVINVISGVKPTWTSNLTTFKIFKGKT